MSDRTLTSRMGRVPLEYTVVRSGGLGLVSREDDDAALEGLVLCAATGDEVAWRDLWSRLEPRLTALLRRRTFIVVSRSDDDCRDVVVAIMSRLREDGFRRLGSYVAMRVADPDLTFMRWLTVVAKRVAIDCLRGHPDYVDHRRSAEGEEPPGLWIETEELPTDGSLSGGRPPMTNRVAAQQILRYAAGVLSDPQRQALELWTEQASCDDIARVLKLDGPEDAERLIHAAVERLRRHFRETPSS